MSKSTERDLEIWESQVAGRTCVTVTDPRTLRTREESILGKGARMRLTAEDRALAQEIIRDSQNDPFKNGSLRRLNRTEENAPLSDDELADDDLAALFSLGIEDFSAAVDHLSQVNVRRLQLLAEERDASVGQTRHIKDLIAERWPVGGDTKTYREMQQTPESAVS